MTGERKGLFLTPHQAATAEAAFVIALGDDPDPPHLTQHQRQSLRTLLRAMRNGTDDEARAVRNG